MIENSFGLFFFLKQPKNQKSDERYVYLRITVDGIAKEISTKRIWNVSKWDQRTGRAKGNKEDALKLNAYLEVFTGQVYSAKSQLMLAGKAISSDAIKKALTGKGDEQKMLLHLLSIHNERMESLIGKEFALATLKRYRTTLTQTRLFLQWKYNKDDISIQDLNYEFISDYSYWLKTVRNCNQNSVLKYISNLKKIVTDCILKGWLQRDPFIGFKLPRKYVQIVPLSKEDLERMSAKVFNIERLALVRDIFLFSCYTGLAYIDVCNLRQSGLIKGFDNELWVTTIRQKTETPTRVPLLPKALEIIERYKDHPRCILQGYALPILSNQKMNSYLKEIADVCGITKKLTFHIARHTFATTVTLGNGVPIETVSKMLGHKSLKQTQHYAKIVDVKIALDMTLLREKLVC